MLTADDRTHAMPSYQSTVTRIHLDVMITTLDRFGASAADVGDALVLRLLARLCAARQTAAEIEERRTLAPACRGVHLAE